MSFKVDDKNELCDNCGNWEWLFGNSSGDRWCENCGYSDEEDEE